MEVSKERGRTYGSFEDNAKLAQELKKICEYGKLDIVMSEALDMICSKISRILCNPYYMDSWRDVAGYANLVLDYLDRHPKSTDTVVQTKSNVVSLEK